jgi:hypothetical protein
MPELEMTQKCAWCGVVLGTVNTPAMSQTSHGLCSTCLELLMKQMQSMECPPEKADPDEKPN